MKTRTSSRETGFTLIELLTVIIIIGVLAAIAIPVFSAQRGRAQDSQTVSDVRNIVTAAESYLSDKNNTADGLSQITTEYQSSKNVSWNIKGVSSGGYCIAAFNTSGKDYNSSSNLLTYDSTAGGLKKNTGTCAANTPTNLSSTFGGNFTITAAATNLQLSRNTSATTTVGVSWTATNDSTVTGYKVERSTDGTNYTTVTTVSGRTNTSYNDTAAGSGNVFYRITPMVGALPSTSLLTGAAISSPAGDGYSRTGNATSYTVPETGTYEISTYGAQGGVYTYGGNNGAYVKANHTLTAGSVLTVVVGSQGSAGYYGSGGGGGTFVYIDGASQPLQVAGGGGGDNYYNATQSGGHFGGAANANPASPGTGNGGNNGNGTGGAGWLNGPTSGGVSKPSWAGALGSNCGGHIGPGGYGGGGGSSCAGAGGGGGYTGGNGGNSGSGASTGGTSYLGSSASLVDSSSSNTGNGKVIITKK